MSSSNILSSLLKDNSRSSSLLSKTFAIHPQSCPRTRSQSISHNQNNTSNKYLPVLRMAHILATKVKKHNYFLFCRLQSNLKTKSILKPIQKEQILRKQEIKEQKKINSSVWREGFNKLSQFFMLNSSKQNLQPYFQLIKREYDLSKKVTHFSQAFNRAMLQKKREGFDGILQQQKNCLKLQIFTEAIENCVKRYQYQISFKKIRAYVIESKILCEKEQRTSNNNTLLTISEEQSLSEEEKIYQTPKNVKKVRQCVQQEDLLVKKKSSIQSSKKQMRQQKSYARITMGKALSHKINIQEQNQVIRNKFSEKNPLYEKMKKNNHLYSENLKIELPELHDNAGLFEQNQQLVTIMETLREEDNSDSRLTLVRSRKNEKSKQKQKSKQPKDNALSLQKYGSNKKSSILQLRKKASHSFFSKKNNYTMDNSIKMQQMMKEIEKIKDKDKINYHQCKISIVLPKKQSGKSYHNSYHNSASKKKKKTEYPSDKKNYPSNKRKSKVIGSQKQNLTIRDKPQIYLDNCQLKTPTYQPTYEKKKATMASYTIEQTITTVRKPKKYESKIESIIENRKTRSSLGSLKIVRDRIHL